MSLSNVAEAVHGVLIGADTQITGVATDTRTLRDGELFVALRGPRFDGHAFITQACAKHAAAALVSEPVTDALSQVRVSDTLQALGNLGTYWRARFSLPVAAVTGSNGKTTVKEMLGSILGPRALINAGNQNNEIGLPLTLCRIRAEHAFAVVEMGMNHLGEIERMSHMARPDVAVITNAAAAHLEGVGTVRDVAQAKSEIFAGMPEAGVAILNADDPFLSFWRERAQPRRCVTFGLARGADVRADVESTFPGARFTLRTPSGSIVVTLRLPGIHNVYNALAAAAAARELNVDLDDIRAGLERLSPVPGRLVPRRARCGARVFDDTYNANPASLRMALDTLGAAPAPRILVLGDMGELGEHAQRLHREVGAQARAAGVSRLFAIGPLTRLAVTAFGSDARHFEQASDLVNALEQEMGPDTTVLIKGSRFMHMESIVAAIVDDGESESGGAH